MYTAFYWFFISQKLFVQNDYELLLLIIVKEQKNSKNFSYLIQKYFGLESFYFNENDTIWITFYPVGVFYTFFTQLMVYSENLES